MPGAGGRSSLLRPPLLILALLCGLAALLRLPNLSGPLWGDEVMSWAFAARPSVWETIRVARSDSSPQLYYALLHALLPLFGQTPLGLRLPSVLLGVLAVPLSYALARAAGFDARAGLWGAAVVACSSVLVYYSQEARNYALLIDLALFSQLALLRCLRGPAPGPPAAYLALMLLIFFTHRYGLFLLAGQVLCLALFGPRRSAVAAGLLLAGLGGLLAYQYAAGAFMAGGSGRAVDGPALLALLNSLTVGTLGMQTVDVLPAPHLLAFPDPVLDRLLPLAGAGLFGLLGLLGLRGLHRLGQAQRRGLLVLAICAATPAGLALLAGSPLSPRPQWLLRGIIYIWPLVYLLAALLCAPLRLRGALLAGVIALNGLALYPYYTRYTRFDDLPALQSLAAEMRPDDLIVADPWYMHVMVRYYVPGHPPMIGYQPRYGWLDVDALNRDDLYGAWVPIRTTPVLRGRVFVYPRKGGVDWLDKFPGAPVYSYDLASRRWVPLR